MASDISASTIFIVGGLMATLVVTAVAAWRMSLVSKLVKRCGGWQHVLFGKGGYAAIGAGTEPEAILPQRIFFHVLVLLCVVTEVPLYAYLAYTTILEKPVNTTGFAATAMYTLHLASYPLLLGAFCVVVSLWSQLAFFQPANWNKSLNRVLFWAAVAYGVVTLAAIVACLLGGGPGAGEFFLGTTFAVFCACSVVALLSVAAALLAVGCLLQARVWRALGAEGCSPSLAATLARLNLVTLACAACFALRGLMLLELLWLAGGKDHGPLFGWRRWEQAARVEWLPHALPCALLLYLMRKTGEVRSAPPAGPEEESLPTMQVGRGAGKVAVGAAGRQEKKLLAAEKGEVKAPGGGYVASGPEAGRAGASLGVRHEEWAYGAVAEPAMT